MRQRARVLVPPLVFVTLAAAGCGTSDKHAAPPTLSSATSTSGVGGLQAEANSAAAGDIPDDQVFLVLRSGRAGYSMKYPEVSPRTR